VPPVDSEERAISPPTQKKNSELLGGGKKSAYSEKKGWTKWWRGRTKRTRRNDLLPKGRAEAKGKKKKR